MHQINTTDKVKLMMNDIGCILKRMPQLQNRKTNQLFTILNGGTTRAVAEITTSGIFNESIHVSETSSDAENETL